MLKNVVYLAVFPHTVVSIIYNAGETQKQLEVSINGSKTLMEIINRKNVEMEKYIQIDELIKYLKRYSLLATNEEQTLGLSHYTSTEKIRYLLRILQSKGPDGEKDFVRALYDSGNDSNIRGHKHLAELLERDGVDIKLVQNTEV